MISLLLAAALAAPVQDEAKCITVSDVLEWMTHEAKRKFVVDEQVTASYGPKRITVATDLMDKTRAYDVGLSLLRSAGLAAVPLEEAAGGSIRIVPVNYARVEALRVYVSADALPRADEFCILVLPVKSGNLRQIHAALINLATPQSVMMNEGSRSIMASDYASNLRKLAALVRVMDSPRAPSYTISVALLEGEAGKESVPEAFKKVDLRTVTDKTSFTLKQQAGVRADFVGEQLRSSASLRLDGKPPLMVNVNASNDRPGVVSIDRMTVSADVEGKPNFTPMLETRLELAEGEWVIAGTLPGSKEGAVQVVLIRVQPLK